MGFLVEQYRLFLVALARNVCVRVPQWVNEGNPDPRPALRYVPLVGLLIGIFCGLVYITAARWFPPAVAVLLSMGSGLLITCSINERGLSQTANGFFPNESGNGCGAVAVCMMLLLKFAALTYLQEEWIATALICGHALSRFAALPLIVRFGQRVSANTDPWIGPGEFLTAAFYGLLPLVFIVTNRSLEPQMHGPLLIGTGAALAVALLTGFALYRRASRINEVGLGTVQQAAEAVFYLGLLISPH